MAMFVGALRGQTDAIQLNAKYGPPVEEVFQVRPNIVLAVSYGPQHEICKLELRPWRFDGVIKVALIDELVNELILSWTRGAIQKMTGIVCMGLCLQFAESSEYSVEQVAQDVQISQHKFGEGWFAVLQSKTCSE